MKTTDKKSRQDDQPRGGKGSLLADISHDLKGYLNPIIGFASVLLQDEQRLKSDQLKHLKTIYESAKKLLDRIDALILLLRLDEDYQTVRQKINLRSLIQEQIALLQEAVSVRQVRIESTCNDQLEAETDPILLGRGIRELLLYLIERIGNGKIAISCGRENNVAKIGVDCPSLVLSPREMESWRAFLRSSEGLSSPEKGIGLWLALARQAVFKAGGQLSLPSEKRWEIQLPLA